MGMSSDTSFSLEGPGKAELTRGGSDPGPGDTAILEGRMDPLGALAAYIAMLKSQGEGIDAGGAFADAPARGRAQQLQGLYDSLVPGRSVLGGQMAGMDSVARGVHSGGGGGGGNDMLYGLSPQAQQERELAQQQFQDAENRKQAALRDSMGETQLASQRQSLAGKQALINPQVLRQILGKILGNL